MLLSCINMLLFIMAGFMLMYLVYRPQINKFEQSLELTIPMLPIIYMLGLYGIGSIAAWFVAGHSDFIEPLTLARVVVPLGCAVAIYFAFWLFDEWLFDLTVIAAVGLTVWLQPLGVGNAYPDLPHYVVQGMAFVFGVAFCLGMRVLNILPHTVSMPLICVCAGLCVLLLVGSTPAYIAFCGALLLGIYWAYLTLNYYDVKIDLDDGACVVMSYLVCNLLLMNLGEFCFTSCMIFTMFLWMEIVVAIWQRLMVTHSGLLRENTNCYNATDIFTLQGLTVNILRVCVVLLFMGWFQLFAVNQYSLLIVSFALALWLGNFNGKSGRATLKEINKEFMSELKQNIEETKNLFTGRKKDGE